MSYTIFLSHRFQDSDIADAIRTQMNEWGVPNANIFQAGVPGQGPEQGADLDEQLVAKARATDFFLMIFTQADEDWSYCTWEHGIATGSETKETKVIVLRCANDRPKVRRGYLDVDADSEKSVMDLVRSFHTQPDFVVPDSKARALAEPSLRALAEVEPSVIEKRGKDLFEAIAHAKPKEIFFQRERLDYLELRLDAEHVTKIANLRKEAKDTGEEAPRADAKALLREQLKTTKRSRESGYNRFGLNDAESSVSLDHLLDTWEDEFRGAWGYPPADFPKLPPEEGSWVDQLLSDFSRSIEGKHSVPTVETMGLPTSGDTRRLQPVVVRTRKLESGAMEFDLYFFKAFNNRTLSNQAAR